MREDAEVPDQRQGARMAIDALVGNLYSTAQPITSFEQIALVFFLTLDSCSI